MENINYLEAFIETIFCYITKIATCPKTYGLFRKHTINLDENGEVSFPVDFNCWKKYITENPSKVNLNARNILEFNSEIQPFCSEKLIQHCVTTCWPLIISKCYIEKHSFHIHFERFSTFKNVLNSILDSNACYGSNNKGLLLNVNVTHELFEKDLNLLSLCQLRVKLLYNVTKKLLEFMKYNIDKNSDVSDSLENSCNIHLVSKVDTNFKNNIICGNVIIIKNGIRSNTLSADEFYKKRSMDMRLMAQHKYGLRITSEPTWDTFFKHLGEAAVTLDLLCNKPIKNVTLNFDNNVVAHNKGASFILYNCARLATLLKKFENQVSNNVYPPAPSIDDIDFNLLSQPEEWELLFIYLLQFPTIVSNSIEDIGESRLNPQYICSFLSGLCSLFSLYYRRVRILTESRNHMIPVLHARIYLLKGIEIVLHNGLWLLDIPPVTQM